MVEKIGAILLVLSFIFLSISVVPGCIEMSHAFEIAQSYIGDKLLYDMKMASVWKDDSEENKNYANGTLYISINGTKFVIDGFGREKEVVEYYMRITNNFSSMENITYGMWRYYDLENGWLLKYTFRFLNYSQSTPPSSLYNRTVEIYPSTRLYEFFGEIYLGLYGGIAPVDTVCIPFEGKTIRKGDKGIIRMFGKEIEWKAVDEEKVNGYRCIKVCFSFSYNLSLPSLPFSAAWPNQNVIYNFHYTIWFSDGFPQIVKMKIILDTNTSYSINLGGGVQTYNMESESTITLTLKDSVRGSEPINWGNKGPSFPERISYGEFGTWSSYPPTGNMSSNISFRIEDAVDYIKTMNLSYFGQHPDARVLVARYLYGENKWKLIFGDGTEQGFMVALSRGEDGIGIEESRRINFTRAFDLPANITTLTFSGCEYVAKRYMTLGDNLTLVFGINSSLLTESVVGLSYIEVNVLYTVSLWGGAGSFYTLPIYIISTDSESVAIDAETGQVMGHFVMV